MSLAAGGTPSSPGPAVLSMGLDALLSTHALPCRVRLKTGFVGSFDQDTLSPGQELTLSNVREVRCLRCCDRHGKGFLVAEDSHQLFSLVRGSGAASAAMAVAQGSSETTASGTAADAEGDEATWQLQADGTAVRTGRTFAVAEVMTMQLPVVVQPFRTNTSKQGVRRRRTARRESQLADVDSGGISVLSVGLEKVVVASTQHKEVLALPIASPSSSALPEHGAKAGSARASATSTEGQRGSEPYQIEVEHLGDSDMDPTATWALSLVDLGLIQMIGSPFPPASPVGRVRRAGPVSAPDSAGLSSASSTKASSVWKERFVLLSKQTEELWLEFASYKHQLRKKIQNEAVLNEEIQRLNKELAEAMKREQQAVGLGSGSIKVKAGSGGGSGEAGSAAINAKWKQKILMMRDQVHRMWTEYQHHKEQLLEKVQMVRHLEDENESLWNQVQELMQAQAQAPLGATSSAYLSSTGPAGGVLEASLPPASTSPSSSPKVQDERIALWRNKMLEMKTQVQKLWGQFQAYKEQIHEKATVIKELEEDNERLRAALDAKMADSLGLGLDNLEI